MRLIWVSVLVLSFFGAYAVAGSTDKTLGMGLFLVAAVAVLVFIVRRSSRAATLNNRALTLMSEGRLVESIALFETAQKDMGLNPLPTYNAALARLWLWRLDEARVALEKSTTSMRGKPLRIVAAPALLFIDAVQNDPARAAVLEQEIATLQIERSSVASMARAAFHARAGRWADVLATLPFERIRPMGGPARAVADALRAWATAELGGAKLPVDTVGVLGETGPDAVKKWWPEFALFLERAAA